MHTLHVIHKKNRIKQSKQLCCNKNSHPTRQWCKWSKKTRFNNKIIYYLRRFILNSEDFSTDENKSSGFNTQCELTTAFSEWNSEINICDLCMHFIWLRLSTYFQWPPIRLFRFLINKKFHTKTKHQQKLNELKKRELIQQHGWKMRSFQQTRLLDMTNNMLGRNESAVLLNRNSASFVFDQMFKPNRMNWLSEKRGRYVFFPQCYWKWKHEKCVIHAEKMHTKHILWFISSFK